MRERRDRLAPRTVNGDRVPLAKLLDAPDMILVVMRGEDRDQPQPLGRDIVQHGLRLARVDHGGDFGVAQRPDIVVLEGAQGNDLKFVFGHGG